MAPKCSQAFSKQELPKIQQHGLWIVGSLDFSLDTPGLPTWSRYCLVLARAEGHPDGLFRLCVLALGHDISNPEIHQHTRPKQVDLHAPRAQRVPRARASLGALAARRGSVGTSFLGGTKHRQVLWRPTNLEDTQFVEDLRHRVGERRREAKHSKTLKLSWNSVGSGK